MLTIELIMILLPLVVVVVTVDVLEVVLLVVVVVVVVVVGGSGRYSGFSAISEVVKHSESIQVSVSKSSTISLTP